MNKIFFFLVLLIPLQFVLAQNSENIFRNDGNITSSKSITNPLVFDINHNEQIYSPQSLNYYPPNVKWFFQDPTAIGGNCMVSGNGHYTSSAWDLNNKRVCLYGNTDNNPYWTFSVPQQTYLSYTAISDTGGVIAISAYQNINLFDNTSNVPIWNFSLTSLPDTGIAGPVAITSDGLYFIASASRSDTSTVFLFSKNSTSSIWKLRVPTEIQGINISRNDSVAIINTYGKFWVVDVYSGNVRYSGVIQGTQVKQGISGNGNYVATIDYYGFLKLYQWTGSTYTLKWQFQEVPGTYYNWHTAVDISNDGTHVIAGTLVFLTSSSYDGRIRYFNVNSNVPLWTYTGCGDEVTSVQFNKAGNIAVASTWGDIDNHNNDFMVFKTLPETNTPLLIYGLITPGSMYNTSISNSGTVAVTNGKAVHARAFGNGGFYYNFDIDTSYPTSVRNPNQVVSEYELFQNYPNPFNPYTIIKFSIPKNAFVNIKIYDMLGREVMTLVNRYYPEGIYSAGFDATYLTSGVYYYKLSTENYSEVKKMILIK